MVLAYLPQRMKRALTTNSNNPPQGVPSAAAAPPSFPNAMLYEDSINMSYEDGVVMDYET